MKYKGEGVMKSGKFSSTNFLDSHISFANIKESLDTSS